MPGDKQAETEMSYVIEAIMGIRTIRGEMNILPSSEVKAAIKTFSDEITTILKTNLHYIKKLSKAVEIEIGHNVKKPVDSAVCVRDFMEIYVPIKGLLNIDTEIDRLTKEGNKVEETLAFLNRKLLNEDFLQRAPEDVVRKEKVKYEELAAKKERIEENIKKMREIRG